MRNPPHPEQADLFRKPVFESRQAVSLIDVDRFRGKMKRAMSAALRDCGLDRDRVCDEMSRQLGTKVHRSMLDAYTSEAKGHEISLVRFKILVRAISAPQLWDVAVSDDGLIVLQGDEARLAEIARLQQEQRAIGEQLRQLRLTPVNIKRDR